MCGVWVAGYDGRMTYFVIDPVDQPRYVSASDFVAEDRALDIDHANGEHAYAAQVQIGHGRFACEECLTPTASLLFAETQL